MPLAIGPAASHRRPARRTRTLTHHARRHLAWSYDLLSADEQALFRRLGVFVGGFTLEAAEYVGGDGGAEDSGGELADHHGANDFHPSVLDGLTALLSHSLVRRLSPTAAPRFAMLETIREYAGECLAANREEVVLRSRHAAYFVTLAERAAPHLTGPEQQVWTRRLEAEHDNMRAALDWPADAGEVAQGLRLTAALDHFWYVRGYSSEGRRWLESTAEAAQDHTDLAALEAEDGHPELAACFLGAVHGLRKDVGDARQDTPTSTDEETTASVRAALGEDAFHAAWEIGRAAPLGDMLAQAEAAATNPGEPAAASVFRRSP